MQTYKSTLFLSPPMSEVKYFVGKTAHQQLTSSNFEESRLSMVQRPPKKLPLPDIDNMKPRRKNPYATEYQIDIVETETSMKMRRRWKISDAVETKKFQGVWEKTNPNYLMIRIEKDVCTARFLSDWYTFSPIVNHFQSPDEPVDKVAQVIKKEKEADRQAKLENEKGKGRRGADGKEPQGEANIYNIDHTQSETAEFGLDFDNKNDDDEEEVAGESDYESESDKEKAPQNLTDESEEEEEEDEEQKSTSDEESAGDEGKDDSPDDLDAPAVKVDYDDEESESENESELESRGSSSTNSQMKTEPRSPPGRTPRDHTQSSKKRKGDSDSLAAPPPKDSSMFVTTSDLIGYMKECGGSKPIENVLKKFKPLLSTSEQKDHFRELMNSVCVLESGNLQLREDVQIKKKPKRPSAST
eukprot:TRINITY_DN2019_c0_g1_i5.p1 TRINITY_DN2019_c0_g1~~TRINITY_DN2019_c0_g1_i5.p1  ORF type:complete len:414 (-),score=121.26 TRINITY_DN2019_c0_g1_i5:163-1404(-)